MINFFNKVFVDFNVSPKHFGGEGALLVRIKQIQIILINYGNK